MTLISNTEEWQDAVRKIITFRYLGDTELEFLLQAGNIEEYDIEEPIVNEGDLDQCIFGILKGTVSVNVSEKDGRQVYICALGSGELFGEAGLFMKIKRTASVVAQEKTTVFRLSREDLTSYIKEHPAAGNKILMVTIYGLLKKLRVTNQELAWERKGDMDQSDIDDLVDGLLSPSEL